MNKVYLMDCMEGMKGTPDGYYDLAVVDPPYGIGAGGVNFKSGTRVRKSTFHKQSDWDVEIPKQEYFDELFRVSKNQVVWGGNYMTDFLPPSRCWFFWDKGTGDNSYADGELAWCSFDSVVKKFDKFWSGAHAKEKSQSDRIHPTQKPIALYDWIFAKYATKGMKILDTHAGSMSSVISAMKNEMQITAYEIDSDYFNAGKKRIENYLMQGDMFNQPKIEFIS